jgi:glutamate-1-semialdehyde aminotransferase
MLSGDGAMMGRLNAGLLEHGVLKGGQKYYPSAVHTDEDIERTIEAYREIVPTLQG